MHRRIFQQMVKFRRPSGSHMSFVGVGRLQVGATHGRLASNVCARMGPWRTAAAQDDDDLVGDGRNLQQLSRVDYMNLVNRIRMYDDRYYSDNPEPEVSDEVYDNLLETLAKFEELRPEWIVPDSPTQKPGFARPSRNFAQVTHCTPMLSLKKSYTFKDLEDFVERVLKEVDSSFCVELKIDGVALRLNYKGGELNQATTRGDGTVGDDVTRNAVEVRGVMPHLPPGMDDVQITGEVCIFSEDFKGLQLEKDTISNVRNSAAGGLKLLDPSAVRERRLTFIAYDLEWIGDTPAPKNFPTSQCEALRRLKQWGFFTSTQWRRCKTAKEIAEFANDMYRQRHKLPMEVDGVVVKVDDNEGRENMGATRRSPRGAVAHKFSGLQAATRVEDIILQVSRNGTLTPVAILQPVRIANVTISRATLNNFGFIKDLDVRKGDVVLIERGGDVIPKIITVDKMSRVGDLSPFTPPKQCPACGGMVVREDRVLRCFNRMCSGQALERLIFFASKNGMNMNCLGEKTIKRLYEAGKAVALPDLLKLTAEDLMSLEKMGEKGSTKIINSIRDAAQNCSFSQVIHSIGVPQCGKHCAELLAKRARNLKGLLALTEDDLVEIPGFGSKTAWTLAEHFRDQRVIDELLELRKLGVRGLGGDLRRRRTTTSRSIESPESDSDEEAPREAVKNNLTVTGKSFAFTGLLENMTRSEAAKLVERYGGVVRSKLSQKTDYLVSGDKPGQKLELAQAAGVVILDKGRFLKLFETVGSAEQAVKDSSSNLVSKTLEASSDSGSTDDGNFELQSSD